MPSGCTAGRHLSRARTAVNTWRILRSERATVPVCVAYEYQIRMWSIVIDRLLIGALLQVISRHQSHNSEGAARTKPVKWIRSEDTLCLENPQLV